MSDSIEAAPPLPEPVLPILVGVEYALIDSPGRAERVARLVAPLGASAAKPPCSQVEWGRMQSAPGALIDFRRLDGFVRGQLARVMGHAGADAVDPTQEFADMGVDSLLAVDLRNRLEAALALSLPATLLFDHPTTEQVVAHLAGLVARGQADEEALLDEIEGLSAEEVERMLYGDGDD